MGNQIGRQLREYGAIWFVLTILLVGVNVRYASAQTEKASVSGRVTDQSNATLPDAEVQIKNTDAGVPTTVKRNGEGVYAVSS